MTSVSLAIYLVDRGAYRVSGTPRNLDYLAIHRFGSFQDYGPQTAAVIRLTSSIGTENVVGSDTT